MFKCTDCGKVVRRVEDIRSCSRCQSNGSAASIHDRHQDSDWLTPAIIGYALGSGFSSHTPFSGGGGEMAGAGASGSFDSPSSDSGSSSSDSSSSDSGSSSSDSGSSSSSSD